MRFRTMTLGIVVGVPLLLVGVGVSAQQSKVKDKQDVISALNRDLASEYQAVVTYRTFASQASDRDLKKTFEKNMKDELDHAGLLADAIVRLGGQPVRRIETPPAATGNRMMLESSIKAEQEAISNYREDIRKAEAAGEPEVRDKLQEILKDENEHQGEFEKYLRSMR